MSQDIRKFFNLKPSRKTTDGLSNTKKRPIVVSSDEDDAKQSPAKSTKSLKNSKKRKILSDSEDELQVLDVLPKVPKDDSKKKESSKKLVAPSDILGKGPIKRGAAPKVARQKKLQEFDVHCDSDFESTLNQLDTSQIEMDYLSELDEKKNSSIDTSNSEKKTFNKSPNKIQREEENHKRDIESTKQSQTEVEITDEKSFQNDTTPNKTPHKTPSKKKAINASHNKLISKKPKSNSKPISKLEIESKTVNKKNVEKGSEKLDVYEERIQQKKQKVELYHQYLNRGGARNPGSKIIPEGADNCLENLVFLITGVLDSLEREEAEELIKKYGGQMVLSISKKVNYIIVGDQAGPSKLTKLCINNSTCDCMIGRTAEKLAIPKLSEDELLEMIRTRAAGKKRSKSVSITPKKTEVNSKHDLKAFHYGESDSNLVSKGEKKNGANPISKESCSTSTVIGTSKTENIKDQVESVSESIEPKDSAAPESGLLTQAEALVDKYKPKTMKQIIGQQGDSSNARKLYAWLKNWHKNHDSKTKPTRLPPWAKKDDGMFFKAVLLSGPPGVGKTTTVQIVCDELKFDLLEFNASDTRSKKLLKDEVKGILSNTSMKNYFTDSKEKPSDKHVLLMDEVDGMAGNEDRGGLQELIILIKSTEIPIICICNDRQHPKMRTLSNYTFDLKFQKPKLEQIKGPMKSICFKEKIDISNQDLEQLILSTNQDIRQTINHLALVVKGSYQQEQSQKQHENKHFKLGPWDVVRKVFSANEHKNMTLYDKSDLFFHDYSIAPLFVQENYLSVKPHGSKDQLLAKIANAANSIATGDIIEKKIRSSSSWSLLPVQAFYSLVIPGTLMSGDITKQINFPSWFGRNSKATKFNRLLQEITAHSRLTTRASNKQAITLDYASHLRNSIVRPLAINGSEGIDISVDIMNKYHLIREDLDSLLEVSSWPDQSDPMQSIDKKVKAAFTRALNKSSATPYSISSTGTKRKSARGSQDEGYIEGEEEEEEDEEEDDENKDDIGSNRMIKVKTSSNQKTEAPQKPEVKPGKSQSKRGRGRGKK